MARASAPHSSCMQSMVAFFDKDAADALAMLDKIEKTLERLKRKALT
jgi:hypothetical protein